MQTGLGCRGDSPEIQNNRQPPWKKEYWQDPPSWVCNDSHWKVTSRKWHQLRMRPSPSSSLLHKQAAMAQQCYLTGPKLTKWRREMRRPLIARLQARPALSSCQQAASSCYFLSHWARAGLGLIVPLLANKLSAHQKMQMNNTENLRKVSGHRLPDTLCFCLWNSQMEIPGALQKREATLQSEKAEIQPWRSPKCVQRGLCELQDLARNTSNSSRAP